MKAARSRLLPIAMLIALVAGAPMQSAARGHGHFRHGRWHAPRAWSFRPRRPRLGAWTPGARDTRGRLERSPAAKHDFERDNPCPSTGRSSGSCRGYIVDHIIPLKRGGADDPSNMQWQTTDDARAKDRVE